MTGTRIGLSAFVIGCAAKGSLVGVYYIAHPDWAFRWIVGYDPLVALFADRLIGLLCPQSGLSPNPCGVVVFDTWMVLGCGLEWALVACLLHALSGVWRRHLFD